MTGAERTVEDFFREINFFYRGGGGVEPDF